MGQDIQQISCNSNCEFSETFSNLSSYLSCKLSRVLSASAATIPARSPDFNFTPFQLISPKQGLTHYIPQTHLPQLPYSLLPVTNAPPCLPRNAGFDVSNKDPPPRLYPLRRHPLHSGVFIHPYRSSSLVSIQPLPPRCILQGKRFTTNHELKYGA